MKIRNWCFAGTAATIFALAPAGMVEAQQVSAALRGDVTGPDGTAVPNASVQIVNTNTGATTTTTTAAGGSFTATGLPIGGPYTVKIEAQGFTGKTLEGISLRLGETLQLQVTLNQMAVEQVVVTGIKLQTATAQVESRGVAKAFSSTDIRDTPLISRDFKEIIQQSPYAYVDPVGGGSNPPVPTLNLAGANPRCTNFLVDGLQQKDNFGLNLQGYPTARSPIPPDWTDQIQLAVTPYDVEYNDTCGGVINIVTKSGSNDFHGTAYYEVKSDNLTGSQFDNVQHLVVAKPLIDEKAWGFTLGGPLVKDKLFFFGGYDRTLSTSSPFGDANAVGPAGSGAGRVATNISEAQVNQIADVARSKYGIDPGDVTAPFTEDNKRYIGKLSWQIDNDNRLVGTYQYAKGGTLAVNGGSTSTTSGQQVTLPSDWYVDAETLKAYSLEEFSKWTDNFSTQLYGGHVGVVGLQSPLGGVSNFPSLFVRTPGPDGVYQSAATAPGSTDDGYVIVGPDFSRQYNYLTYKNDFGKAVATFSADQHIFKGGIEYHEIAILDQFLQGAGSVVRFDSLSDFQNGIVATSPLNSAFTGGTASSTLQAGNSVFIANGAITHNPSDTDANFKFGIGSGFIEDEWYATENLNFQFGLRYDEYYSSDKPVLNPNFGLRYGFSNQGNLDGLNAWLPRASFSYNLTPDWMQLPDTALTLRGGVGRYSGGFQTVWVTNNYGTTGITSVAAAGIPGQGSFSGVPSNLAAAGVLSGGQFNETTWLNDLNTGPLASASVLKNSTVNAMLPNFKLPNTWRMNLGTDITFGDGWLGSGWQATFDFLHLSSYAQPYWTNLRVRPSTQTAPDGRFIYQWTFDPANGRPDPAGGVTTTPLTGSDIGIGSADGGTGTFLIAAVQKQWTDTGLGDFNVNLGYAHSKVTDISPSTSSTASSNYANRASLNYNEPEVGTSDYERVHRVTAQLNWSEKFFGDSATRLNLFFQRMSGQHYSFTFSGNPFGPTSGGTTNRSLLYVPMTDPATGLVTATSDPKALFKSGFDFTGFNAMLKATGLLKYAGEIVPRNAFSGRWDSLLNLGLEQEIPSAFEGHHIVLSMAIFNFGNLINKHWGQYTSPNFYQAYTVATVDSLTGTTSSCGLSGPAIASKYCYTAFSSTAAVQTNFSTTRAASVWSMQLGARYEF